MAISTSAASTRHIKRKRENEAPIQRQVAQKLQLCADVSDSFVSIRRSLHRQLQRYKTQKAHADELSRIRVAVEQMTQFQALFGAEMDGECAEKSQVMSLHQRTNKLLNKVSSQKKPVALRIQQTCKKLPRLMTKATSIVSERRQLIKEQQELPRHQWVPMVLWKIYDGVVEVVEKEEEKKPLKTAMHEVMRTLKETNPFFYLQVLYQPPPEHLDRRWEVEASGKLTAITASMEPYFLELKRRSAALNSRNSYVRIHHGWNQLRITLAFTRRAARHFHFLILHLYAVAMGCDAPNVHAGIISEKAARRILSDDTELRDRLGLCRDSASSEDYLLKETYEWTPELLAYLDAWRWHRDSVRGFLGFDRRERHQDFLPQFFFRGHPKRRIPRCDLLAEIGYHFRDVDRVWRRSRLGTSSFKSMTIEDIGALEKKIKSSFGAVVDLVYKMMLARWMDRRRKRSAEWWSTLKLRERQQLGCELGEFDIPDELLADYAEDSEDDVSEVVAPVEPNEDLQDVTDAESIEQKEAQRTRVTLPAQGAFRRPTTVTLRKVVAHASAANVVRAEVPTPPDPAAPKILPLVRPVRLRETYAWTDEEISDSSRSIADLRAAMVGLCDRLQWSKVYLDTATKTKTRPDFGEFVCKDWRMTCIASQMCALTGKAVAFAEEAAMHDTLTEKPSLSLTDDITVLVEDSNNQTASQVAPEGPTINELQKSVRLAHHNVAEMLSPYDGQHSTEWHNAIVYTGLSTLELLRMISQSEAVHEISWEMKVEASNSHRFWNVAGA